MLGSQAEEIFCRAHCPVLTVGPHSARACGDSIRQILYATHFTPEWAAAAPYAISFAQEYQAALTLLHIILDARQGDLVQPQELRASSERLLHDLVPSGAEIWSDIHFEVKQGLAAETILDLPKRKKYHRECPALQRTCRCQPPIRSSLPRFSRAHSPHIVTAVTSRGTLQLQEVR